MHIKGESDISGWPFVDAANSAKRPSDEWSGRASERTEILEYEFHQERVTLQPTDVKTPGLRVLVVDDEPAVQRVLTTLLSERGFSVLTASDLRSAMHRARTNRPDVILLDVRLGAEDGLELVGLLRAAGLAIPCVVLTGHAGPHEGFKVHELGVIALVEKPSSPDEIAAAVRRAAGKAPPTDRVPLTEDPYDAANTGGGRLPIQPLIKMLSDSTELASRADRMSRVLTGLIPREADVHSIDDLCQHSLIGVAPSTFRRWCQDLGINPGLAVEFARLLRAATRATGHGTSLGDWLD